MELTTIQNLARELSERICQWSAAVPALERDCVLSRLRALYEGVLALDPAPADRPLEVPAQTPIPIPEPEPEPVVEPEIAQAPIDPDEDTHARKRRAILSLYEHDEPEPIAEPEPEPVEEPVGFQIEEVVFEDDDEQPVPPPQKTAAKSAKPAFEHISGLSAAIGLNDRFMLIGDLFGGDEALYDRTLAHLEQIDDLDDCLVYLSENFPRWDAAAPSTVFLVDLLERKLL